MHLPRRLLLVLTSVSVVVAAGAGFYVVQRKAPDAAMLRLYVDIGLFVTLGLIVFGTTGARPQLLTELAEALRLLSHGRHERRLDPNEFGTLEDVARAYNEAAASLSEMDDPNLGPVQTKPRSDQLRSPDASRPVSNAGQRSKEREKDRGKSNNESDDALSDHPELGEVRRLPKKAPPSEQAEVTTPSTSPDPAKKSERSDEAEQPEEVDATESELTVDLPDASNASVDGATEEEANPPEPAPDEAQLLAELGTLDPAENADFDDDDAPTILEPASASAPDDSNELEADDRNDDNDQPDAEDPRRNAAVSRRAGSRGLGSRRAGSRELESDDATAGSRGLKSDDATSESEPIYPTRSELKTLFDAFVKEKVDAKADTSDLEFESFADTLEDESRRLVHDHKCRGIRFEITIESGEVSLLPHLLR